MNEEQPAEKPVQEHIPIPCPRCGQEKLFLTKTKRTFAWKCENCGFDTNWLQDVMGHRKKELEAIPMLKQMFPQLIFVENIPIDAEPITGEKGRATVRYDCGVYWFGTKIAKLKIVVIQGQQRNHYLETQEQYVQGRQEVFDYLAKIDALLVFYFPDEQMEVSKIAVASCKEIKKFAVEVQDRFKNTQYSIPAEIRKVIVKTEYKDIKDLIFRNLIDHISENLYIV